MSFALVNLHTNQGRSADRNRLTLWPIPNHPSGLSGYGCDQTIMSWPPGGYFMRLPGIQHVSHSFISEMLRRSVLSNRIGRISMKKRADYEKRGFPCTRPS